MNSLAKEFDDIRPYEDNEIGDAMQRIADNPYFNYIVEFLYPGIPAEAVKAKFRTYNTVDIFQVSVMNAAIQNILKNSSSGLSYSGIDDLSNSSRYLFLSNHRDILLDSAILQIILHIENHETSEITFGDNLMSSELIVDIGKSNKMFKLVRSGTPKQIFINSLHTSRYIRYAINQKRQSIWIAQRNGRTKDGNDQTQQAVLKMFGMSGGHDFVQNFDELHIAPLAISYEYDPGDFLKTREIYISRRQAYVKAPGEDLNSIITGIKQFKGKIHLAFAPPISTEDLISIGSVRKNESVDNLAKLIDERVYRNFRLWNTNYIAYDLLNGKKSESFYSAEERSAFIDYMKKSLSTIEGDKTELESIFLGIYANPVENNIKISGLPYKSGIREIKNFEYTLNPKS